MPIFPMSISGHVNLGTGGATFKIVTEIMSTQRHTLLESASIQFQNTFTVNVKQLELYLLFIEISL